jgi:hypothetical protein
MQIEPAPVYIDKQLLLMVNFAFGIWHSAIVDGLKNKLFSAIN